ncbi:hypothetical protein ACMGE6_01945 [Macrococcus equi]|uniref:hypothetical protein n=1 Tax=Macrococcus equi TaxID=3395462 RepID=UPI0039BE20EC
MKKGLIAMTVMLLLAVTAFLVVHTMHKDQSVVTSADIKDIKKSYPYYEEAKSHVDELAMEQLNDMSVRNEFFKMNDGKYFNLRTYTGNGNIMHSYLTFDDTGKTNVAFPKVISHQYKDKQFITNDWTLSTPAGKMRYMSGEIDNGDDPSHIIMKDKDGTHGVLLDQEVNKDVIFIGDNGEWLSNANERIGTEEKVTRFATHEQAVNTTLKKVNDAGKKVATLTNGDVTFYFFQQPYGPVAEYTVIPVLKDNTAGIYHKFTLTGFQEEIIDKKFDYALKGHKYTIIFNDDLAHAKQFKHKKVNENIIIAVQ